MWGKWYKTDDDCCQHMRRDGSRFEMIEIVWLDITYEDKKSGCHEYVIVRGMIDLDWFSKEEIEGYISPYQYTIEGLHEMYGEDIGDIIAECILEEDIMTDNCIVDEANSFGEATDIIMKIIAEG